jgi:hypothetical protein
MEIKPPGTGSVSGPGNVGRPSGPSKELLRLVSKVKGAAHIPPPFPTYSDRVPPGASHVDKFARNRIV